MNYNDILTRIQKGENPEDIVKEFTDNINKAQAEVAAEAAKKKEENAKSEKKDEIAGTIAHALNEYIAISGIEADELRGAEVRELLDEVLPFVDTLKNVKVHVTKTAPKTLDSADKILRGWLRDLGW